MNYLKVHLLHVCLLLASATGAAAGKENLQRMHQASERPVPGSSHDADHNTAQKLLVYIGGYTQRGSRGIHIFRMDSGTGELTALGEGPDVPNPSFLAISPDGHHLYAVNEVGNFEGKPSGAVTSFEVTPGSGALHLLNQQPSGGSGPCHLSVDHSGKVVLVANYGSGSVAALPIKADGSLGAPSSTVQHRGHSVNPQRQEGPHAHSITVSPDNRFAVAADLGLDKLLVYRLDPATSELTQNEPWGAETAAGAGPRHFAFHPNGQWAYVINELNSTVTFFEYDAQRGRLHPTQTVSTLPDGFAKTNYPAEVQVSPDGHFLYGSNRGHDSIAVFRIDSRSGSLSPVDYTPTGGHNPRNFCIDPTGRFLLAANQDSGNVEEFRRDAETGRLTPTGVTLSVPSPVCVTMVRE